MLPDAPPFPGLRPEAFDFLRALREHNERDWFTPRKSTYHDELRDPLRLLAADLSRALPGRGLDLSASDPNKAVFRIYRDTRFSKNKAPYKTNASLALGPGGDRKAPGGLYVHIEPGHTFVAGGYWNPEPKALGRWREAIATDPGRMVALAETLRDAGLAFDTGPSERLKRMPRGFNDYKESPAAEFLRWKGFVARRDLPDSAAMSPDFTDRVAEIALAMRPLYDYGRPLYGSAE